MTRRLKIASAGAIAAMFNHYFTRLAIAFRVDVATPAEMASRIEQWPQLKQGLVHEICFLIHLSDLENS